MSSTEEAEAVGCVVAGSPPAGASSSLTSFFFPQSARGVEVIAAGESPEGPPFVDYYVVGQGGDSVASRQWLGSEIGYVAMHMLRR